MLPYWIETILSLRKPGGDEPGNLAKLVAAEYLFPLIPPNTAASFTTTTLPGRNFRGLYAYAEIFYRVQFGNILPGVFQFTAVLSGDTAYNATVTGSSLEQGINYMFFMTPNRNLTSYITNLTNQNQYFEMTSQYLVISTEKDWQTLKKYLLEMQFPYKLPD